MANNWYFEEKGERVGPFDDRGIKREVAAGRLTADTLVWNERMVDWTPASKTELVNSIPSSPIEPDVEVVEVSDASGASSELPGANSAADILQSDSAEVAQCANCGGMFKNDELVDIDGAPVCADCKPQYLRKLQEGGDVNSVYFRYAGFWIRALALFIDGLILTVVQIPLTILFAAAVGAVGSAFDNSETAGSMAVILIQIVNMAISMGIQLLYNVIFLVKKGATPGKMALGLRVINADGSKQISYGKAIGRYFAKMLNGFTLNIGYMMAGWDSEKRGLHDRICDTRVIYTK